MVDELLVYRTFQKGAIGFAKGHQGIGKAWTPETVPVLCSLALRTMTLLPYLRQHDPIRLHVKVELICHRGIGMDVDGPKLGHHATRSVWEYPHASSCATVAARFPSFNKKAARLPHQVVQLCSLPT